jgi:GH43 family beta-xylosidase
MSSENKIVGIRHKFATLRNQTIHINLNGHQLKTTIDKVDELFEYNVVRYCVNNILFMMDKQRQETIDYNSQLYITKMNNTANIPAEMSGYEHDQQLFIEIKIDDVDDVLPSYCIKGQVGTSWDIHSNPLTADNIDCINYLTGTLDKKETNVVKLN